MDGIEGCLRQINSINQRRAKVERELLQEGNASSTSKHNRRNTLMQMPDFQMDGNMVHFPVAKLGQPNSKKNFLKYLKAEKSQKRQ